MSYDQEAAATAARKTTEAQRGLAAANDRLTIVTAERDALAAFVAELLESGPLRIRKVFQPSHYECLGCYRIAFEPDDIRHTDECLRERARKALEG